MKKRIFLALIFAASSLQSKKIFERCWHSFPTTITVGDTVEVEYPAPHSSSNSEILLIKGDTVIAQKPGKATLHFNDLALKTSHGRKKIKGGNVTVTVVETPTPDAQSSFDL